MLDLKDGTLFLLGIAVFALIIGLHSHERAKNGKLKEILHASS